MSREINKRLYERETLINCKGWYIYEKALGLTQTEIGKIAGVSASVVSNLEAGEEVSIPVFNSVKWALDNQFAALDRLGYMEAMLKMHTIQLGDMEGDERILCLGYISIYSNKLQMELLRMNQNRD